MSEKEGKEEESAPLIEETSQLLNPFVHRLELNTAYDKFKLVLMSIFVVPVRVVGIMITLLVAYILASAGLWGLSRDQLAARPLSGWRRPASHEKGERRRRRGCFPPSRPTDPTTDTPTTHRLTQHRPTERPTHAEHSD
ncbi:1-acylglycerophosphocholine O-acyltransferase 1 [Penaeus vannamei]|uniref:1-acylglycerophosphocholine O-acyltransferase 1 n=1 Tax=Penaeus vannamei TaxID=6689 RepID=A0A423TKX8_PENVA|nr:1-acylglycerophosphocholine O-acyltransferase 1 [Penaeus vannamei]